MRKFNKIFIIVIWFTSLILMVNMLSVKGVSDITYTFNRDSVIDYEIGDTINQTINLRNETYYNRIEGIYGGTDSFEGEEVGTTSTDISFVSVDDSAADCFIIIEEYLGLHHKIISFTDDSVVGGIDMDHSLNGDQVSGTMEFWFRITDKTLSFYINFIDGLATTKFWMYTAGSRLICYDGATPVNTGTLVNDFWHYIRIDFECGGGGYKGLGSDEYRIFFDGVLWGNFAFAENSAHVHSTRYITEAGQSTFSVYMDGVGETFNNYDIGDNIFPLEYTKEVMETSRYEFAFEAPDDFYEATDTLNVWDKIETSNGFVLVVPHNDPLFDRELAFTCVDGDDVAGVENDNMASPTGIIYQEVSFDMSLTSEGVIGNGMDFRVELYSDDDTHIFGLRISEYGTGSVEVSLWSGGFFSVRDDLVEDDIQQFEILINYDIDIAQVRYSKNGVFQESYSKGLAVSGKVGLNKVSALLTTSDPSAVFLDNIVIRSNGSGFVADYGYYAFIPETSLSYNPQNNNLLNIIAGEGIEIAVCEKNDGIYKPDYFGNDYTPIIDLQNFENELVFINTYEYAPFTIDDVVVLAYFILQDLSLSLLTIDGVKITDNNATDYPLIYSYGNVSAIESYFYVDSTHKLQFNLITNDTNLEWMEGSFNIPDISTIDTAIGFTSKINSNGFGFMRYKYVSTSQLFPLSTIVRTQRIVIEQNQTLTDIAVLITDIDIDSVIGSTNGYVERLIIFSTSNIYPAILTFNLIQMMIPLIIILLPTIAISGAFDKKLIIPLFLLMSIILFITGLIPTWLFFVIAISISSFILIDTNPIGVV